MEWKMESLNIHAFLVIKLVIKLHLTSMLSSNLCLDDSGIENYSLLNIRSP